MTEERRKDDRTPSAEIIRVISDGEAGGERTFPVIIRDKSDLGLGAVYVGSEPPSREDDFYFEMADGSLQHMRLAWIESLGQDVHLLGFEIYTE